MDEATPASPPVRLQQFATTNAVATRPASARAIVAAAAAMLTLGASILIGCAPRKFEDPVESMANPELSEGQTLAAMRQASMIAPDDPDRISTLKSIMSAPGYSLAMRREAFELLYEHDPDDARRTLLYRLPSFPSWDFIEYACHRIAEEGWVGFAPALVRSLARPMPVWEIEERPETQALKALFPGHDVRAVVFDVVAVQTNDPVFQRWRYSAWDVLHKLGGAESWRERLLTLETDDPFLLNLQAGARDLLVIARTQEEIKWLETLRLPQYANWWSRARALVHALSDEEREGLALRHLPVLLSVQDHYPDWLDRSGESLAAELRMRIEPRKHIELPAGSSSYRPQALDAALEKMSWGDLLSVLLADYTLQDDSLRATIFDIAGQDQRDPTTEYGGVIDLSPDGPAAELFVPRRRENDLKFYASTAMIVRGYTAPFHFHFHVQERDNREFAGPGLGDLEYADALGINGVIFTSVGRGALNVDFYAPNDIIIDLGTMSGP